MLAAWNGVVEQGRGDMKEETVDPPNWRRMAANKGERAGDRPPWLPDGWVSFLGFFPLRLLGPCDCGQLGVVVVFDIV